MLILSLAIKVLGNASIHLGDIYRAYVLKNLSMVSSKWNSPILVTSNHKGPC